MTTLVAFGYDLGGDAAGWKLRDFELGMIIADLELPWFDESHSDEIDVVDMINAELQVWEPGQSFITTQRYVSYDYPRIALVISSTVLNYAHGNAARSVSRALIESDDRLDVWNVQLQIALRHLGLKPTQSRAEWLLMSFWG